MRRTYSHLQPGLPADRRGCPLAVPVLPQGFVGGAKDGHGSASGIAAGISGLVKFGR